MGIDVDVVSERLEKFTGMIDKLTEVVNKVPNLIMDIGVMKVGYDAAGGNIGGALAGKVALELARSDNIVAGASGVGVLGILGLTSIVNQDGIPQTDPASTVFDVLLDAIGWDGIAVARGIETGIVGTESTGKTDTKAQLTAKQVCEQQGGIWKQGLFGPFCFIPSGGGSV